MTLTLNLSPKPDACRLFQYDEKEQKYIFCGEYIGEKIIIDKVKSDCEIILSLQAVNYVNFFGHRLGFLGDSRELTITPEKLSDIKLNISANPKNRKVSISWDMDQGSEYEVYLFDNYGTMSFT